MGLADQSVVGDDGADGRWPAPWTAALADPARPRGRPARGLGGRGHRHAESPAPAGDTSGGGPLPGSRTVRWSGPGVTADTTPVDATATTARRNGAQRRPGRARPEPSGRQCAGITCAPGGKPPGNSLLGPLRPRLHRQQRRSDAPRRHRHHHPCRAPVVPRERQLPGRRRRHRPGGGGHPRHRAGPREQRTRRFEQHYELYGRKVEWVDYESRFGNDTQEVQGRGREGACLDAEVIANELKAFAVVGDRER